VPDSPALEILYYGDPRLRQKARPIERVDEGIRNLAKKMHQLLHQWGGLGLSAPQLGYPLALAVVDISQVESAVPSLILVNPVIVETTGWKVEEETCLSIPGIREVIERPESIRLNFWDLEGKSQSIRCGGLLARIIQHEIDHLKGVLFVDYLPLSRKRFLAGKLQAIARRKGPAHPGPPKR